MSSYAGHTTIHGKNHNNASAYCDASKEQPYNEQQRMPKISGHPDATVESMKAVQVVDRLRWWRTNRVREHPIPIDHVVLRGSYVNYSCFGRRPIAPGVTRLLHRARTVLLQYRHEEQRQRREAYAQRQQASHLRMSSNTGTPLYSAGGERLNSVAREAGHAAGCAADEGNCRHDECQSHHLCEMREREKFDNKRKSAVASSPLQSPRPLTYDATTSIAGPAEQRYPATRQSICAEVSVAGSCRTVSPLIKTSSKLPKASEAPSPTSRAPSEQEARAAERLLSLFRPRAASAPLRSHRQRYTASELNVAEYAIGGGSSFQRDQGCPVSEELHPKSRNSASTGDEMASACHAHGAAKSVIVLYHAPRLILYEKGLNPRRALRAARISSDALEGLSDAAAESSADVFAMTNLPLSSFERFFYQDQFREVEVTSYNHMSNTRSSLSPEGVDTDAGNAEIPRREETSAGVGAARTTDITTSNDSSFVGGGGALFFGSPLMAGPACLPSTGASHRFADARQVTPRRDRCRGGGRNYRRGGGGSALRAVSVPILPLVHRGGYPQMVTGTSHIYRSRQALPQISQRNSNPPSSIIPAGLRTSTVPEDGAHMCFRVDDLQDVYVFNPVVDMIGKGAFSKVYAAVPILRGEEGLRRFASPLLDGCAAASGSEALGSAVRGKEGNPEPRSPYAPAVSRRAIPVVALKIIPRKARRHPRAGPGVHAPTPSTVAPAVGRVAANAHQAAQNSGSSVRRELVEIEREVSILRRLHHTGCSQFFEAIRTPDAFVIAMGIFPGSIDAQHYLARYGPPSEARAALMLFQLLSTVQYLHTNFGLIHRDIKLENMILSAVDFSVSDACIQEVLGTTVHKFDTSTTEAGDGGGRQVRPPTSTAASTRTAARLGYSKASHHVERLLRVTLIDFGLARRTRASSLSPAAAALRCRGAGVRHSSLNTSITSPVTGTQQVPKGLSHNTHSSSLGMLSSPCAGGVMGGIAPINGGSSSSCGLTSSKAPPPRPPLLRQPASAVGTAGAARVGPGGGGITGIDSTVAHVGMPSPMPSTMNMFTCFLDREEEIDEEENGGVGPALESAITANTAGKVVDLSRGSRQDITAPRDDSGAFSTDVSASETDLESLSSSTGEPEEGGMSKSRQCRNPTSRNDSATHPALLSPSVLTSQRQTLSETATNALPQSRLPTPMHPSRATAATPDHLNTVYSGSHSNTSGPHPGGLGLRNPSAVHNGSSHPHPPNAPAIVAASGHSGLDDTDATLLITPCGTEKYLPPEMLSWILEHGWVRRSTTVGLARAMDMYPVGIVAYVLLSGCFPFNASSRATLLKQQQRVPRCNTPRWAGVSSAAITFVQRLLDPNPLKRMTAKEALEHPFLREARQIAERLSLVPHGEDEELPRPSGIPGGVHVENHQHHHNSSSAGRHFDDEANMHARSPQVTATTAATATVNVSYSAPSPVLARRTHAEALIDRASTHRNATSGETTHEDCSRRTCALQRPGTAGESLPLSISCGSSSVALHGGAGGGAGIRSYGAESVAARTATASKDGCPLPDPLFTRGGTGGNEERDIFASITRDMFGGERAQLRTCQEAFCMSTSAPVTPTATAINQSSFFVPHTTPTTAATFGDGTCEKQVVLPEVAAAVASTPASPPLPLCEDSQTANQILSTPSAALVTSAKAFEGETDDLFESLYNHIMFSD